MKNKILPTVVAVLLMGSFYHIAAQESTPTLTPTATPTSTAVSPAPHTEIKPNLEAYKFENRIGEIREEAAVRKFVLEEIERWNSNGPLVAERYTADSDYVDVNGKWTRGLADRKNKRDSPRLRNSKGTLIDLHIRFIRPDVAIVHQTHDMSGKRGPNGEELPTERQLSTRVLVKERGKWVQTAFQNTIVRPVEPESK